MDSNMMPLNIYIDHSDAFSTSDHLLLLSKVEYYGITGCSYDLLKNYLSNRSQCVEFYGHRFNTLPISTGVPHGSLLGSLLFLMYADNTTLYTVTLTKI